MAGKWWGHWWVIHSSVTQWRLRVQQRMVWTLWWASHRPCLPPQCKEAMPSRSWSQSRGKTWISLRLIQSWKSYLLCQWLILGTSRFQWIWLSQWDMRSLVELLRKRHDFNRASGSQLLSTSEHEQGRLATGDQSATDLGHCDQQSRGMERTGVLDDTLDSLHLWTLRPACPLCPLLV